MYFGASFSRYGFDFRPLFVELFSRTARTKFQNTLEEANQNFQQSLQSYTFDQYVQLPSADILTSAFVPPMILVNYTPLAIYCNGLLTGFNDLRICCPLAVVNEVKEILTHSLTAIRNRLVNYYNSERVTLTVIESEHFIEFLRVFVLIFLPYIDSCLQALFPDNQLAKELGLSVLDVSEKSKLNRLDLEQIAEPIRKIIDSVLPKKIVPTVEEESASNEVQANGEEEQSDVTE